MICAQCGTENEAGRKFCKECAARLAIACAGCGFANAPDAKFCGECATALGAATLTTPSGPGPNARSTITPLGQIAERRLVSVLFADLVGFTPFAEERDAEEVRETLSRYFELGREVVARYGGTLEKFIGDALMAVWGTPTAHEDDAERAVRAALELVDLVPSVGAGISARAAVMTGEAAVTIGATDQGMVAGDLVNTAARLQTSASPGTVLVGEATQRAASQAITFESVGEQQLKGKEGPVGAWRALRVVAEVGGRNRAEQLEAPFVGRDEEMRQLKELFHATGRERRPRLVSVSGPAGIGKSRFAWEFAKYIDGLVDDVYWHAGRSPAYGEGVTFWALGEMVRERAGLAESDHEATTRERIGATVAEWLPDAEEARWVEGSLLALLGIETERASTERLFAAWRTFFERIAARGPVVLLFEDLHWADEGLLDFIDHLLEWTREAPLFVLTLARPELFERRPDWATRPRRFSSIVLEPLPAADMRALLAGLVPGLPATAAESITGRSDGIPLYAVETVRMLLAEGRLTANADGVYEPTDDLAELAVPQTLTALIAARLDALDPAERSLVADAAVLGQSFSAAALAAVSGVDEATLEPRLRALVRRELLTELRDPRSPERGQYSFVQSLIREVAYGTLSRRDRRRLHLAAARYFETLGSDEIAGALAGQLLAAHANSAAGDEADAVATQARIALKAAGERASQLNAHAQAQALYEQALTVTSDQAERAELLQLAGVAATNAGRADRSLALLSEAVGIRREVGDRNALLQAITAQGAALGRVYRAEEAIELLRPTIAEFGDLSDLVVAEAKNVLARALMAHGELRAAVALTEEVLVTAENADAPGLVAEALIARGSALVDVGRAYEGMGVIRAGIELADSLDLSVIALRGWVNMIAALNNRDPRMAVETTRSALPQATAVGMPPALSALVTNAAEGALWTGDWDWIQTTIGSVLELDLSVEEVAFLRLYLVPIAAARNADAVAWGEVEVLQGISDVDGLATFYLMRALAKLALGDLVAARSEALESARLSALNAVASYPIAARAAIWMRDAASARADFEGLEATRARGQATALHRLVISAGITALRGNANDARARYREALAGWRDAGLPVLEAWTAMDMAHVLDPSAPEVRAAVDRAREIFEGLRARAFLDRLDEALERPATSGAQLS